MLSNESFDDFKITFLNRYGTAFHDSAVCHVEGRFDARQVTAYLMVGRTGVSEGESGEPGILAFAPGLFDDAQHRRKE